MTQSVIDPHMEAPPRRPTLASSTPSRSEEGTSQLTRLFGLIGLVVLVFGAFMWLWNYKAAIPTFNVDLVRVWITLGAIGLFYHLLRERDVLLRRVYAAGGFVLVLSGMMVTTVMVAQGLGLELLPAVIVASVVGLLLLLYTAGAMSRTEDEPSAPGISGIVGLLGRSVQGLTTSSLVQKVFLAGMLVVLISVYLSHSTFTTATLPYSLAGLLLGAGVLFLYTQQENEINWRDAAAALIGVIGLLTAFCGLSSLWTDLVWKDILMATEGSALANGLTLSVIGLFFCWAFISMKGSDTDPGYYAAIAMSIVGGLVIVGVVIRSLHAYYQGTEYFVAAGYLLLLLGCGFALVGVMFWSDYRLVVLTRREFTALFYSPIAYIVILTLAEVVWMAFWIFTQGLGPQGPRAARSLAEPIFERYFWDIFPVIFMITIVPALTMRLLSEEKQSGTIEVLLTAPVGETAVVLSKFFGALIVFIVTWSLWIFYPIVFRIAGDEGFDYRPLLSLQLGVAIMGTGFIAMGLFISSLVRQQIVAFLITYAAMINLTVPLFLYHFWGNTSTMPEWLREGLLYCSYLYQLRELIEGKVHLKFIVSNLTFAILWLFLTVKVLEARKWK